ncbi:MAG: histidine-type phosphatase [Bryobacteraceae bacterium]|jgi:4-phytase/acid phosphatase
MTRKVHERFPLSAAALTLALVIWGALAWAQPLPNMDQTITPLGTGLGGAPDSLGRAARPVDDTQLKQVIIFGRHSVRAPIVANSTLDSFSALPFPAFPVDTGILTPNGATLETILGGYYRLWLTKEGLLTGNDPADASFTYFRANVIERTIATAKAFGSGLLPAATVNVINANPTPPNDPLFDPVGAGVARLDARMAVAAVKGRLGDNPQSLASAYASELALTRSILFDYPASETPVPATPEGKVDVTTIPIDVTAGTNGSPVTIGGMSSVLLATDPFIMEYADGLPASDVGWGRLSPGGISQISRIYNLLLDLEFRTPYLDKVQSSNVASHVVRSMVQSATGNAMTGALGNPSTKVIVLIASDVNVTGLGGLFHLDWILPGYQTDFCGPGGALVFQLRQSQSTGEYVVRASYIAQTLNQLRSLTPLTLATPPAIAPLFIPGCSVHNATFDCPLADFVPLARHAIDPLSADLTE